MNSPKTIKTPEETDIIRKNIRQKVSELNEALKQTDGTGLWVSNAVMSSGQLQLTISESIRG